MRGFTLAEFMIVLVIVVILFSVVHAVVSGDVPHVTTYQTYESPFATHAFGRPGETAKVNTGRRLRGVPYWITSLHCNEDAPTEQNQLHCRATLRHQTEGNTEENRSVLCDQARNECDADGDCVHHESTGCVPNEF